MSYFQFDLKNKIYSGNDASLRMGRIAKIVTIMIMVGGLFGFLFADAFAFDYTQNSDEDLITAYESQLVSMASLQGLDPVNVDDLNYGIHYRTLSSNKRGNGK
ncbi:MAG: hypothetical protein GWP17_00840 [Aquificales bacterium]|nr:hypothetical protein [Aquificales bacterium]